MKKSALIVLLAFTVFGITGCEESVLDSAINNYLPLGADNIVDAGNCWYTFEYDGKEFLYYKPYTENGYEAITQIQ